MGMECFVNWNPSLRILIRDVPTSLNVMKEAGRQLSPPLLPLMASLLITVQSNVEEIQKVAKLMSDSASSQEALII